ncbi:MAG: hypothetical protein HRT90_01330, partial [Candidatus Margulisbacteria bacterium]|nr:hypothetical protein [Candidatus Margulisiibacteriota bacterium]
MFTFRKEKADTFFNTFFLVCICILALGIPLFFTSLTRSVFEVNKLMLFRIVTLIIIGGWFFKYILYRANGFDNPPSKSVSILGFRWLKTGFEIPLLLWFIANIISTIFSENIRISIFGAYDRWEGLITITNYIILILILTKLVTNNRQLQWIFGFVMLAAGLSALYGVFQNLGLDFMPWSVDPTHRVFACINNPVHFCAYVAMVVPLGMGWIYYLTDREHKNPHSSQKAHLLKLVIVAATSLIYYTQFLSYSRATWMGFIGAMTLFYMFSGRLIPTQKSRFLMADFFFTCVAIGTLYIRFIFSGNEMGPIVSTTIIVILAIYCFFSYILVVLEGNSKNLKLDITLIKTTLILSFGYLIFLADIPFLMGNLLAAFRIIGAIILLLFAISLPHKC